MNYGNLREFKVNNSEGQGAEHRTYRLLLLNWNFGGGTLKTEATQVLFAVKSLVLFTGIARATHRPQ